MPPLMRYSWTSLGIAREHLLDGHERRELFRVGEIEAAKRRSRRPGRRGSASAAVSASPQRRAGDGRGHGGRPVAWSAAAKALTAGFRTYRPTHATSAPTGAETRDAAALSRRPCRSHVEHAHQREIEFLAELANRLVAAVDELAAELGVKRRDRRLAKRPHTAADPIAASMMRTTAPGEPARVPPTVRPVRRRPR